MADDYAVLEGQGRTLDKWSKQTKKWDACNSKIAQKLGRDADSTLMNTQWKFRDKQEQIAALEASIPPEQRAHGHDWQMSLRGGSADSGVKYVKVGGSYPYPLYIPIKQGNTEPPSSNKTMKILSPSKSKYQNLQSQGKIAERRAVDSEYFHTKMKELKKHMMQKVPHMVQGSIEPLELQGQAPPITDKPNDILDAKEDVLGCSMRGPLLPETEAVLSEAERVASRESRHSTLVSDAGHGAFKEGPHLEVTSPYLMMKSEPGVLTQSSVFVRNTGTTAVYYNWVRVTAESIAPRREQDPQFNLSGVPSGVMLPEEERYFTFGFQHDGVGCYTDDWELQAVPSIRAPIKVRLRGVVVSRDEDPIARQNLDTDMQAKMRVAGMQEFFTKILNVQKDNVFGASDAAQAEQDALMAKQRAEEEAEQKEAERQRKWYEYNGSMGLHYSYAIYKQLEKLHQSVHTYVFVVGSPPGSGMGLDPTDGVDVGRAAEEWGGSISLLAEEIQQVDDPLVRLELLASYNSLIEATRFDWREDEEMQSLIKKHDTEPLLAYSCMHNALLSFVDNYIERSHHLQVQMGLVDEPEIPAGKAGKGKDNKPKKKEDPKKKAATPEPKRVKGKKGGADEANPMETEEEREKRVEMEYKEKSEQEALMIMQDSISQFCAKLQAVETRQETLIDADIRVTFRARIQEQEERYHAQKEEERLKAANEGEQAKEEEDDKAKKGKKK